MIEHGPDGRPALSYDLSKRLGRPWARRAALLSEHAAEVVTTRLAGWFVTVEPVSATTGGLVERGAIPQRHAFAMARDLVADPPPTEWLEQPPPAGVRITGCDRSAEDLFPANRAAYPPGHPDHIADDAGILALITGLLTGTELGPLLPYSALAVDERDHVVGGVLIADHADGPPWVADVFRDPSPAYAGLGSVLLKRALAGAARDGVPLIGLAVTAGNPARSVYERLGFQVTSEAKTFLIPA